MSNNELLKRRMRAEGLTFWRVAKKCGVTEWTLGRWLREEVDNDKEKLISEAIDSLTAKGDC